MLHRSAQEAGSVVSHGVSPVRRVVTRSNGRVVGWLFSQKMGCMMPWESQIERDFLIILEVDPDVLARFPSAQPEPPRDPEKQHMLDEAVAQLRAIIEGGLTPRQREIVQAYFFEGRTEAEIARDLGIAQQVVSRHLFGALRAGRRVGGAMAKLRKLAEALGIDPEKWV